MRSLIFLAVLLGGCVAVVNGKVGVEPPKGWYTIYFQANASNVNWPVTVEDNGGVGFDLWSAELALPFSGPYMLSNASAFNVSVDLESGETVSAEWFCNPLGGKDRAEANERAGTCIVTVQNEQINAPSGDDCPCTQY